MEWISSLLRLQCPFCRSSRGDCRLACASCATEMTRLEEAPPVREELSSREAPGLPLIALGEYEGWLQNLIRGQKSCLTPAAVRWLAGALHRKLPVEWNGLPLLWVPGPFWRGLHLVEALALELDRRGRPLTARPFLERRLRAGPSQKLLNDQSRRARKAAAVYRLGKRQKAAPPAVILLDDVATTGSTLRGCARLLREELGIEVRGTAALAYTPRRICPLVTPPH